MSACRRVGVAAGAALACLLLAARSRPRRRARASALRRLLEPKAPPTEPHKCVTEWDWRRDVNPHYTSYRLTDDDFNVTAPSDCDAPTAVVCEVRRFNVKQKVRNEWQHQQQALLPCASLFERYDPKIPRTVCPMDGEMRATHGFTAHFLQLMRAEVVNGVRGPCAARPCQVRGGHVKPSFVPPDELFYMTGNHDMEMLWLAAGTADALRRRAGAPAGAFAGPPRLGVLNRGTSRKWLEAPAYVAALRARLSDYGLASADHVAFDDVKNNSAQAAWVWSHDIIVTPHGAQESNLIFARPCTVVLEVSPRGFYLPGFYGTLALGADLVYFSTPPACEGGPDAVYDKNLTDRRWVNLLADLPLELALAATRDLVAARAACLARRDAPGAPAPAPPADGALADVVAALRAENARLEADAAALEARNAALAAQIRDAAAILAGR